VQRREFIKSAVLTVASSTAYQFPGVALAEEPVDEKVKTVLVVFKCHLDVGFTDTQANVMNTYFKKYYPQAMDLAAGLRRDHADRYMWTTGSWLLYEYLEQASADERKRMEQAVLAGDIAWHALPFSWQTEMLDRSMIEGCLALSGTLDARFGKKTIAGKMTDVPGHSRGLISPLAAGGIRLLDIGVNSASTPPEVPEVFLWKDPDGSSLAVLYHTRQYGGTVRVPNSDLAVSIQVRDDNQGPHTPEEIKAIYQTLRQQFPSANVSAANLSQVAEGMEGARATLPVVTSEIGDTWIYGAPSDPPKVASYREVVRLRREWIANDRFRSGDPTDRQLLRRLALVAEHTWGTDTKRYIDHEHYAPKDLALYLGKPNYQIMERSWQEKRDNIGAGVANLPAALKAEAQARLQALQVAPPDSATIQIADISQPIRTAHFELAFSPKTGSIQRLVNTATGKSWASPEHPLALFSYQTLSQADFTQFLSVYVRSKESWAPQDFGKPNIDKLNAESRTWTPAVKEFWIQETQDHHRMLARLAIEDTASEQRGLVAWPPSMFLEVICPRADAVVELRFYALQKSPNRMPEAMWLSFSPQTTHDPLWSLTKVNQEVLATEVIRGGGRHMHAVTDQFACRDGNDRLTIETLDAPVIAFSPQSPLNFSKDLPDQRDGVHVSLFNNAWGTNYPQWAGGDWLYRFLLRG
jgi:Domain of unknown function (DUF5054)